MNAPFNLKKSARRRSRETALQCLYQWLISPTEVGLILAHAQEFDEFKKCDKRHFEKILQGCIQDQPQLDALISLHIDRKINELSPVEHATLLIGAWELKFGIDIPYKVIINEAVELAKLFGATDGHKYVNGVLDKMATQLRDIEIQSQRTST